MSSVVRNKRDGVLKIIDGDGLTTVISFAEGDFTYNEPEKAEPIPVLERKGDLRHLKRNDPFSGWGKVSFSFKYVDYAIKKLLNPPAAKTTAIEADMVTDRYPCVKVVYEIYDDAVVAETHTLYNVWFDPAKSVFTEGEDFSTMNAEGVIFGKYDAGAYGHRIFAEVA